MCPRSFYQSMHKELGDYLEKRMGYRPAIEPDEALQSVLLIFDIELHVLELAVKLGKVTLLVGNLGNKLCFTRFGIV